METYFDENLIAAHNGTNFVVEKETKYKNAEEDNTPKHTQHLSLIHI